MYERFTHRSRIVMQLAYQEAVRLNHDVINTSHLLLALLKEGSGVAAHVLQNAGLSLRFIREQADVIYGPVATAKEPVEGKLPQTPRLKTVLSMAMDCAKDLGHGYVGTEHLLLGLLREGQGPACQILANLNIDPFALVRSVYALLDIPDQSEKKEVASEASRMLIEDLRCEANHYKKGGDGHTAALLNRAADEIDQLLKLSETVAAECWRKIMSESLEGQLKKLDVQPGDTVVLEIAEGLPFPSPDEQLRISAKYEWMLGPGVRFIMTPPGCKITKLPEPPTDDPQLPRGGYF